MSTPNNDDQILKRLGDAALQNVEATTIYVLFYGAARTVSGRLSINLNLSFHGVIGVLLVLFGASVSTVWFVLFVKRNMTLQLVSDLQLITYNILGHEDPQARLPLSSFRRQSSVSFFILYKSGRISAPPSCSYENFWWSRPICRCRKGRG